MRSFDLFEEKQSIREGNSKIEGKIKIDFYLFLSDLRDNSVFKIIMATMFSITYSCVYICVLMCQGKGSNGTRNEGFVSTVGPGTT